MLGGRVVGLGPPPLNPYEQIKGLKPVDAIDYGVSVAVKFSSMVGPAGGKTVAVGASFSNPYVDRERRIHAIPVACTRRMFA